jgi:hypothetical protein
MVEAYWKYFPWYALLFFIIIKKIKRAFEFAHTFRYEVKIYEGTFYGCMPKEAFEGINISSIIQQMGGEGVAKRMDAAAFGYTGFFFAL